ncbi:MAG: phosphoribosylglycinamide formyltransferase [Flavobacteriales bacterium]
MKDSNAVRLAILASGAGSNARNIIEYFASRPDVEIALVASNKKDAGVLSIAEENSISTFLLSRSNFKEGEEFLKVLSDCRIDAIILAGFLWKVPAHLITSFPDKIINIHPALLPKYGGKGMYGHFVHEAVAANNEKESGITIHIVNEHYDEGAIVFQARAALSENATPQEIEMKVRALEMENFPVVIDRWIKSTLQK